MPWETCRTHEYHNLIALCPNCHGRADRGEIDRKALRIYKASLRFSHDRFSQFEMDALSEACKLQDHHGLHYPRGMELLIKRLLDARLVDLVENINGSARSFGVRIDPYLLVATSEGRKYYSSLGLETEDWRADDA